VIKQPLACEMETNPRSLQSNLKPLKPYPSWFFHNHHSCLLKKKSLRTPPPHPEQTWGSSLLPIGPLAFSTQAPQCFIHKIWLQMDLV